VEPEPPPVRDETAEFATLAGGPGAAAVEEEITLRPPPRAPSRTPQPRTRAEGRRYRTAASIVASVIALAVGGVLIFMAATSRDLPFLSDEADVANASEPGEGTDDGGAVEPAEPPPPGETPTETAPAAPAPSTETVSVLAAGDIAECGPQSGDELTAEILGAHPDATILTLGDNAYPDGTEEEFAACYEPSWGRYKDRTRPASGNHDHHTKDAAGFAAYFGEAAGPFDKYYYSYDLGAWHLVVLNSDCWRVGGCESDDEQIEWLRQDIADHPTACTLAYFHRPPFSSGRYGDLEDTARVQPLWQALHEEGVDVVLTGHEHSYERFAPMDDNGQRDEASGIRLFIVGTGGGNLRKYTRPLRPTTEMRQGDTWGVLELTLRPDGYDWEFLPVKGGTFQDSGSGACH
jgi:hypothetical protein